MRQCMDADNLHRRLKKIIGQVQAIDKMIDEDIAMNLPNEWTDRITALANDSLCTVPYGVWFAGTLKENLADQAGKWSCIPLPAVEEGGNNQRTTAGRGEVLKNGTFVQIRRIPLRV